MAATTIIITNLTSRNISLGGGIPTLMHNNHLDVDLRKIFGKELVCNGLADLIDASSVTVTRGGVTVSSDIMVALGRGVSMTRDEYDNDDDVKVDVAQTAEALTLDSVSIAFADSPYTVTTETLVRVSTHAGAVTVNLPEGSEGKSILVTDTHGDVSIRAITVVPDGAETIMGAANYVLSTNFGTVEFAYDLATTDWDVIRKPVDKSVVEAETTVTATPHTVANASQVILVDTATIAAASAITLPAVAAVAAGKRVLVKDSTGSAPLYNIVVSPAAGNIEGAASVSIVKAFGWVEFESNGSVWKIINRAVDKSIVEAETPVTATPHVVALNSHILLVDTATIAAASAVNLPAVSTIPSGKRYLVKDSTGSAPLYPITISPAAGNIEGSATLIIRKAYGWFELESTGSAWKIVDSSVDKSIVEAETPVSATPHSVALNSHILLVDTATIAAASAVNLPAVATISSGKRYVVKDSTGSAATYPITVSPAAGNIDGAGTFVISRAYGWVEVESDGSNWKVVNASEDKSLVASSILVTATPHAVAVTSNVLRIDTVAIGAAVAVNLPAVAAVPAGKVYEVKDATGSASTFNITVSPAAGTIDGAATAVIRSSYGCLKVISDGANWKILSKPEFRTGEVHVTQAVAATADVLAFYAPSAGRIIAVLAKPGVAAAAGESLTVGCEIGGVSCMTAPATINQASALGVVAGTVNSAANTFAATNIIEFAATYAAGGGPSPISSTVFEVWYELF
jgi:hypothetical protein